MPVTILVKKRVLTFAEYRRWAQHQFADASSFGLLLVAATSQQAADSLRGDDDEYLRRRESLFRARAIFSIVRERQRNPPLKDRFAPVFTVQTAGPLVLGTAVHKVEALING